MLQPHAMVTSAMQECLDHGWGIAGKIIECVHLKVIVNNLTAHFAGIFCRHTSPQVCSQTASAEHKLQSRHRHTVTSARLCLFTVRKANKLVLGDRHH